MTITKKTRLLKKLQKVVIDFMSVTADEGMVTIRGDNLDAARDLQIDPSAFVRTFPVTMTASGGRCCTVTMGQVLESGSWGREWTGAPVTFPIESGEEITLSFEVDPAKTDFEQGTVSKTVPVAG